MTRPRHPRAFTSVLVGALGFGAIATAAVAVAEEEGPGTLDDEAVDQDEAGEESPGVDTFEEDAGDEDPDAEDPDAEDPGEEGPGELSVERVRGDDRYATAVEAASRAHPDGSSEALVATGTDFPDALAATARAATEEVPLLLAPPRVDGVLSDEVRGMGVDAVTIAGGTGAVPYIAEVDLRAAGLEQGRVAGENRFDTAALLGVGATGDEVVVASGRDFADAVSGAALAGADDRALLLVEPNAVPRDTAEALEALAPAASIVVGGEAAISAGVAGELPEPRRVAGADRVATAAAVAQERIADGLTPEEVVVASARSFADALSAGALAAALDAPLLLAEPNPDPGDGAIEFLDEYAPAIEQLVVVGGTAAVPQDTVTALEDALTRARSENEEGAAEGDAADEAVEEDTAEAEETDDE